MISAVSPAGAAPGQGPPEADPRLQVDLRGFRGGRSRDQGGTGRARFAHTERGRDGRPADGALGWMAEAVARPVFLMGPGKAA